MRRGASQPATVTRRTALRLLALGSLAGTLGIAAQISSARQASAQVPDVPWDALATGGHVALIRHATAPGVGDPSAFALDDCSTQRNLSADGQAQAVRIGETFRARGVAVEQVLSSGWCRCMDTATLAFGTAEVWPVLHSFFRDATSEWERTQELRERVGAWSGTGTLVLVTHQVNITALTDIFPASGEIIVLAPEQVGGFTIVGRTTVA